jgi:integration host factor subunit beta
MINVDGDEPPSQTSESKGAILTKADLVVEVSRAAEISRHEATDVVELVLDTIVSALHRGDKIEIRNFGSFRTRQRRARIGRNPKTGARVEVPPKKIPYFKPSKELLQLVNAHQQKYSPPSHLADRT